MKKANHHAKNYLFLLRGTAQPLIGYVWLPEKNVLLTGSSGELIQICQHSILMYRKSIDILAFQNTTSPF